MANATADYNSSIRLQRGQSQYTVAAGQTFYAGCFVQLDNAGNLRVLDATSTNKIVGQFVRLSPDGLSAEVREGDVSCDNDATNAVVQGTVGAKVYAADDHSVSTLNTLPVLGILVGFDAASKPIVRVTLETAR